MGNCHIFEDHFITQPTAGKFCLFVVIFLSGDGIILMGATVLDIMVAWREEKYMKENKLLKSQNLL